jgi:very-short-patch-repair endonuclease
MNNENQTCVHTENYVKKPLIERCFDKSFSSHPKSQKKMRYITARSVFKSSGNKYYFKCEDCHHPFNISLANVTNGGKWCPFCANRKLCDKDDCELCFNKSFASHPKSQFWLHEKNGDILPRSVFKSSRNKYYFKCEDCDHPFNSPLYSVTNGGNWCGICKNKTEEKLFRHVKSIFPNLIQQYRTEWCKNPTSGRYFPFDFCLLDHKVLVELDGPQHFVQVRNWIPPEEQYERDNFKQELANKNGFSVIRLLQEDVWKDKYDWINELKESILKCEEKAVQNIYMCKNDEYERFHSLVG